MYHNLLPIYGVLKLRTEKKIFMNSTFEKIFPLKQDKLYFLKTNLMYNS